MKKLAMIFVITLVTLFTSLNAQAHRHNFHHKRNARPVVIIRPTPIPAPRREVVVIKPRREVVVIKHHPRLKRRVVYRAR
jgi:hypothetical protein